MSAQFQDLPPIVKSAVERLLFGQPVTQQVLKQKARELVSGIGPLFLDDVKRVSEAEPSDFHHKVKVIVALALEMLQEEIRDASRYPGNLTQAQKLQVLMQRRAMLMGVLTNIMQLEHDNIKAMAQNLRG